MNTLYDLLGVRPDADDETLKRAFHKGVKATHPDLHANATDAPLRFWQIVVANGILHDAKQRAVCSRLLVWERQRLQSKWKRSIISEAIAVAVLTVALVGGYTLFAPIPTTAVVTIKQDDDTSAAVAAVKKDDDTSAAVAAVKKDDDTSAAVAAVKKDDDTSAAGAAVKKDDDTSTAGAAVKKDDDTSTAVAAVKKDDDTSTASAAVKKD